MTETKKRQRDFEDDDLEITPSPAKYRKVDKEEISPFENITAAVTRSNLLPFLNVQDLASLSQVSQYQRGQTEDKRAFEYEKHERLKRAKRKILREIDEILEYDPNESDLDSDDENDNPFESKVRAEFIKRIIDDIWSIPFDEKSWNRPILARQITKKDKSGYLSELLSSYINSKYDFYDFKSFFNPKVLPGNLVTIVPRILKSKRLSRDEKQKLLETFTSTVVSANSIFSLFGKIEMLKDADLLQPILSRFFVEHPSEKGRFLSFLGLSSQQNPYFVEKWISAFGKTQNENVQEQVEVEEQVD